MRDSEIEQWVLNEIRLTTGGRFRELCIFSLNGGVTLKGTVRRRADKLAVQQAAERANGVVRVINQLSVRRSNRLARRRAAFKGQVGTFHFPDHKPASRSQAAN
jgi:BON domain-containing protein